MPTYNAHVYNMPTYNAHVYFLELEPFDSMVETSHEIIFDAESLLEAIKAIKRYADRYNYLKFTGLKIKAIKNHINEKGEIIGNPSETDGHSASWKYDRISFDEFVHHIEHTQERFFG